MTERGCDRDVVQCQVKVKELRNAYCKACEANGCSSAAPAICKFYKELDVILGGDPTSTATITMDTSEPSTARGEEEEESPSEGAEAGGDTPESLEARRQELFSSQEEGSQSWRPVLGEGQTPEEVPGANLRSQPSVLSPADRLRRLRKRPHKSKVIHQSVEENRKAQKWRKSKRRIRQENVMHWRESTERLSSIMERQADSIQALVAMQAEHYSVCPPPAALTPKLSPLWPHAQLASMKDITKK
ncbi:uncharacterized protein RBU57_000244 [Macrochelys suwanniensis]